MDAVIEANLTRRDKVLGYYQGIYLTIKDNYIKVRLVHISILNENQSQLRIHIFQVINNSEFSLNFVKSI